MKSIKTKQISSNAKPSVLHISTADNIGGSGRSAYKIHRGIKALGHTSKMLVSIKSTNDTDVSYVAFNKYLQRLDKLLGRLIDFLGLQNFGYFFSFFILFRRAFLYADVIHLYNLHHYYINQFLPLFFIRKKIVWRLSDQWPMTGHCAYSYSCDRWKHGCGSCPQLKEYDPLTWDTSAFLWWIKKKVYSNLNMEVVAPSRWMQRVAMESPILNRFPVHYIPNGIDIKIYKPAPKKDLRKSLDIPLEKKVIIFSAHGFESQRKGGHFIKSAISSLPESIKSKIFLLLVGEGKIDSFSFLGIECKILKEFEDENRLASFYQLADFGIFPSSAENLPNTVLECMACGVPCIGFSVGGIVDAIVENETGFLVNPGDIESLKRAIIRMTNENELLERLAKNSVQKIQAEFTLEKQAELFSKLYHRLCEKE